jgi:hypothetical protein
MEKTASDSGLFCFYLVSVGIGHALSLQIYTYSKILYICVLKNLNYMLKNCLLLLAILFTVNGMAQTACNLLAPTVTSSKSYVCMGGWEQSNLQATGAKGQEKYKWYASETDPTPIYNDSIYNYTPNRWEDNKLVFEGDTLVKYFWVSIANGTCESPKTKYKIEVIVTPGNFNNWNNNQTYCSGDSPFIGLHQQTILFLPADFESWQYRYTWRTDVQCNDKNLFESFENYGMDLRINEPIKLNTGKTINETGKEITTHIIIHLMPDEGFDTKYCNYINLLMPIQVTVSPSLKLRTTKSSNASVTMAWDTITPAPTNYTINYRINKDTTNHKESLKEVYSYTVSNLKKGDTVYFSIIPNGINCSKTYETIGVAEEKIISCYIPTQNLVGWWPFNGNINDESGNGNHGQLNEWNTTTFTKDRFGNENKAYEFSDNNYSPIKIPYSSILNSTSMTFSGWFKTKNLPTSIWDSRILITKPNAYGIKIALTPSTAKNYINVNRNYEAGYTSKMEIDTNNWYHFVYVHDEKTGSKLFINGKLENSSSENGPLTTNFDRICFGGENNWSNFKGYLDDIAIFNKALDSNEVKALYNQTCNQETATLKLLNETRINAYPNPTSDVLHIEIGDAKALEGFRYRILDALGKEVYNELVKNTLTEIPLKTLGAAGMYQLEILDANKTSIQTNKIVLQ